MKTLKQADNYIKKVIGKGIDFDGQYGYQCADLSVDYMYYITDKKVRMWGNAKDLINNDFKGLATSGGSVKPNQTMTFNKLVKSKGFEWGKLTNYKGQTEYVPIRPLSKSRNAWGVLK